MQTFVQCEIECVMPSEISQRKTNTIYHLCVESKKIQQTSEYYKKGDSQIERTNQWLLQWGEGQYRGGGVGGLNYQV